MHPSRITSLRAAAMLVGLFLLVAGCGGGDEPAEEAADGAAATAAAEDAPDEGEDVGGQGGEPVVSTGATDLGTVLTTADGLTLYGFTNDTDGTSACYDDCAQTWPPLLVEEGFAVADDLDPAVFTTAERDDGTLQLVAGDWPLYTFAGDAEPGEVNGQEVGGVWFAVAPDGELIRDAGGQATEASQTGPGRDY